MSLSTGGMRESKAAEKPVIPGNFSGRQRAGLWNNAPIPLIPFTSRARPVPTPNP
jgi:hypothetical protein